MWPLKILQIQKYTNKKIKTNIKNKNTQKIKIKQINTETNKQIDILKKQ